MLRVPLFGLGIGIVLGGMILFIASFAQQRKMRNPVLIRWAGVMGMASGALLGVIAFFWQ